MKRVSHKWIVSARANALVCCGVMAFVCVQIPAGDREVPNLDKQIGDTCSICEKVDGGDVVVVASIVLNGVVYDGDELPAVQKLFFRVHFREQTSIRAPPTLNV
ncbi:MAG: hypothetical protein AAF438_02055 [Pseudomonadota bacterium]